MGFPSSAIRTAMDITRTAMAIPMVTDTAMGPLTAGTGQVTPDMAPAITAAATATALMVMVTTVTVSIAAVITPAIAPTEVDQALLVCSDN